MRRGITAGFIPCLLQDSFHGRHTGTLAIGTSDCDYKRIGRLLAAGVRNSLSAVKTELDLARMHTGDILQPGVERASFGGHCFNSDDLRGGALEIE